MRRATMGLCGLGIATIVVVGTRIPFALSDGNSAPVAQETGIAMILVEDANAALDLRHSVVAQLAVDAAVGESFAFSAPIDGTWVTIDLSPASVRSPKYQVLVQIEDGSLQSVEPSPETTVGGSILEIPGTRAAGALMEDGLHLSILMPDGTTRWIEPLAGRLPGAALDDYVVYHGDDVIPNGKLCGTDHEAFGDAGGGVETGSGDCGGLCVAEIAFDADFEYYQARGSSVANVESRIGLIMGIVNNLYSSQCGITHQTTTVIVRTSEPDPYTAFDSTQLLTQFRNWWLANAGGIPRDVAHLLTGRNITGSVIGQAWTIGGICTTSGYAHAQSDCCGSLACASDLTAHELGHLWAATHVSDGQTMNPSITCALNFSQSNRTQIIGHRNSRTCLDPFDPGPPPSNFNLLTPAPGATGVPVNTAFDWSDAAVVQNYSLQVDDDADFSSPIVNMLSLGASNFGGGLSLEEGRTYFWRVVASNSVGETPSTPAVGSFTTLRDCNGNGIDDAIELQNPNNDCNGNGVLDDCDINGAFLASSSDLGPIFSGNPQQFVMNDAPQATGDVLLVFNAQADLNFASEVFDVEVNGVPLGQIFISGFSDCTLGRDFRVIPAATWNAALNGGPTTISIIPSPQVDVSCQASWVLVRTQYNGTPNSADANQNGIPDECEGTVTPGDMNCDGIVTPSDIAGFVLALTDPTAYAAQFPNCNINNGDINDDGIISPSDIAGFVALLTGP